MQKIEIDHHITEIMALPCVKACIKTLDGESVYYIIKPDDSEDYNTLSVYPGEVLIEENGRWRVERKRQKPLYRECKVIRRKRN